MTWDDTENGRDSDWKSVLKLRITVVEMENLPDSE